jgi:hypothetical protein
VNEDEIVGAMATALRRMLKMHDMMMQKIDHANAFYDAETIREMNEAPMQARQVLRDAGEDL